jgi:hypothetical protein
VEVIVPKLLLPKVEFGSAKFGVLVRLNTPRSHRQQFASAAVELRAGLIGVAISLLEDRSLEHFTPTSLRAPSR